MADPISCNNLDHASLISTVGEQSRLIGQLFAKIQDLEQKLEAAQKVTHDPPALQDPVDQAPNFASGDSYGGQQDYPAPAPSAYETKKAQAQGQLCNYGSNCTREQCWYEHPGSKSAGASKPNTLAGNQSQSAGNSTKRIKQDCKFGIDCTRKTCWFEHPSGWVPTDNETQWSQPQQESSTEVPAAEVDGWGANEDLSSWGATPNNDWGPPVDNSWGTPAPADNSWGNATENSWNAPSDQPKPPSKKPKSASTSMSREGSVSNSSTSKSQGRGRKARGKGRRADSESIATESTPMSPASLAPTPMSAHIEPIPARTPLSPLAQALDQTSSIDELNISDEMGTPPLEPSVPSSSSEPEAPSTPKALWSDEPNIDVVYFPDPPSHISESQSPDSKDRSMDFPEDQLAPKLVDESLDLDQSAPSDLYSSWGVTGASASEWGLDPNEFPDSAPVVDNKTSSKKSKGKGKQKETSSNATKGRDTPISHSSNPAARSETRTPSVDESSEPEPTPKPVPDPPQSVPHDEIPDWLLGEDEDAHATLGIPRSVTPKPSAPSAPSRLASTNPAPRAPLSKLAGENFPALSGLLPTSKPSQPKDESPAKTFSPRPVGWKITRTSDSSSSSSSGRGKGSKPNDGSGTK